MPSGEVMQCGCRGENSVGMSAWALSYSPGTVLSFLTCKVGIMISSTSRTIVSLLRK